MDLNELKVDHEFDGQWQPFPLKYLTPNHPPRDQERWDRLRESMGKHGWVGRPIIALAQAWCASHRIQVAKELGMTQVPVLWVPGDGMARESNFDPRDPGMRLAHFHTVYGDNHPIVKAIKREQGCS